MQTKYVVTIDGKQVLSLAGEYVVVEVGSANSTQLYTFKSYASSKHQGGKSKGAARKSTQRGQLYTKR